MASVFLNDVDDYLAPSQACVNPLYTNGDETPQDEVKPRMRRRKRDAEEIPAAPPSLTSTPTTTPVQASLADCLACSGCVTTAETVLLEQHHSLQAWQKRPRDKPWLVVLSSASASADWELDNSHVLATLLVDLLDVQAVVDGSMALQASRHAAAQAFVQDRSFRLTSACPAFVCWAETTCHDAVPLLQTTPSSLGGYYYHSSDCHVLHMAPCHDKKLEVARPESQRHVQMVLTTDECRQLLEQALEDRMVEDGLVDYARSLPLVPQWKGLGWTLAHGPAWITDGGVSRTSDGFFAVGSGGYADYIFRYACRELYQFETPADLPWEAVSSTGNQPRSRRVARSQRDYRQVALYRHANGSLSLSPGPERLLRFGIAYGMATITKVIPEAVQDSSLFDYIEVMACPSGCINGGGQIAPSGETPSEMRARLQRSREKYAAEPAGDAWKVLPMATKPVFHKIPPLQHTRGAVAGVKVEDTRW